MRLYLRLADLIVQKRSAGPIAHLWAVAAFGLRCSVGHRPRWEAAKAHQGTSPPRVLGRYPRLPCAAGLFSHAGRQAVWTEQVGPPAYTSFLGQYKNRRWSLAFVWDFWGSNFVHLLKMLLRNLLFISLSLSLSEEINSSCKILSTLSG